MYSDYDVITWGAGLGAGNTYDEGVFPSIVSCTVSGMNTTSDAL